MLDQTKRFGKFTSSEIYKLLTRAKNGVDFGKPAQTYIREKLMELEFGRSIDKNVSSREMEWGKLCESRVFHIMKDDISYTPMHEITLQHPLYARWVGTPDADRQRLKVVSETKCPFTHVSFYNLVKSFEIGGIEEVMAVHDKGEQYYWQCVSNADLLGYNKAELIVYMPYQKELEEIRLESANFGFPWIGFTQDEDLPYLLNDGKFKNINVLPFDIPNSDIELLRYSVEMAEKEICKKLGIEYKAYIATPIDEGMIIDSINFPK